MAFFISLKILAVKRNISEALGVAISMLSAMETMTLPNIWGQAKHLDSSNYNDKGRVFNFRHFSFWRCSPNSRCKKYVQTNARWSLTPGGH